MEHTWDTTYLTGKEIDTVLTLYLSLECLIHKFGTVLAKFFIGPEEVLCLLNCLL
jgi:hypothetical protein